MASRHLATTPPPPSGVHTPPTPRFGYADPWEPYSPRKSARISARNLDKTPSPGAPSADSHFLRSPRTSTRNSRAHNNIMATPAESPLKKPSRSAGLESARRQTTRAPTDKPTASASAPKKSNLEAPAAAMAKLLTPAKTPQRSPQKQNQARINAVRRNLFAAEPAAPTSSPKTTERVMPGTETRRKPKKYSGVSLESFTVEEQEEPIAIFTDSKERVPEVDHSEDNPFYDVESHPVAPPSERTLRRRSKRTVMVVGAGRQTVDETLLRQDGMLYNFRGAPFFKKFSDAKGTRATFPARRLFVKKEQQETHADEDEEADTDIEEHNLTHLEPVLESSPAAEGVLQTPVRAVVASVEATPNAPRLGNLDGIHSSAATLKDIASTPSPIKKNAAPRTSASDKWRRTKTPEIGTAATEEKSAKRSGEPLANPSSAKRTRSRALTPE